METKVTKYFSKPLMKQNIKSNWILIVIIMVIMIMMSTVLNYAMSIMGGDSHAEDVTEYQSEFYSYLGAIATYNTMSGSKLSYEDFIAVEDKTAYDAAFQMLNAQADMELSTEGFNESIEGLEKSDIAISSYVRQFEYNYALMQSKGVFSGDDLTVQGMMETMFEMMGLDSELMEKMSFMDSSAMINSMYYTVIGLLPIFLLIVILGNSLIADQVDKGSMAYVLSTPTKRRAVTITQMVFMIVVPLIVLIPVCISRIVTTNIFFDEVNVAMIIALYAGMYVLVETVSSICYMGSCLFDRSRSSMAFGGGLTVWFFLASLLGMFGSDMMIDMGIGVKELGIFNKTTLVGLYDINALSTIGTDSVDLSFIWKLAILLGITVVCYSVGSIKFQRKDLPL